MIIEHDYIFLGCTRMSKTVPTKHGLRLQVERAAFEAVHQSDELYARHIRATHNLNPNKKYVFEIFDTLPEGWTTNMYYTGYSPLRYGGEYMWCEFGKPYLNRYPGDYKKNPAYRQGIVRRAK